MALTYFVRMRAIEGRERAVQELLLSNMQRIRQGETGNIAFAVHRSRTDPREFWLYETWIDDDAVARHESGRAFKEYRERLRPLVESESVLFGDAEPLAALGYSLPEGGATLPERFVHALGTGAPALLDEIYDPDVVLYTPLAWPVRGRDAVKEFVAQFHSAYPGMRVTLHDQFFSADRTRACFRFVIAFENRGTFYGKPPTGEAGTMSETHAVRLRDGKIVEQFVGDNNFSMPYQELVKWGMEFPRDTPDPHTAIAEATSSSDAWDPTTSPS